MCYNTITDYNNAELPGIFTSFTVLNTGKLRWVFPPFPGDTPPTTFVPYSIACLLWKVPCLPVNPWHITLVAALSFRLARVAV
jgi:hypothetical protein